MPVGRFLEGVGFGRAVRHANAGDMLDIRLTILNIEGNEVTNTSETVAL